MAMGLVLPELNEVTRRFMLREFEMEQTSNPYVPTVLSEAGCRVWPLMMRNALSLGSDVSLAGDLQEVPELFVGREAYWRAGVQRFRALNPVQAANRLATNEFNTWYVRGFSARLLEEGVEEVVVFRAAEPRWAAAGCAAHEGQVVPVRDVYLGHRARYWPVADPSAFSVPFQPGCHHSIARVA